MTIPKVRAGQNGQARGLERNGGGPQQAGQSDSPERGGYAWLAPTVTCDVCAQTHWGVGRRASVAPKVYPPCFAHEDAKLD